MELIKKILKRLNEYRIYIFSIIFYPFYKKKYKYSFYSDVELVDEIINNKKSIARFGDGEFKWIFNIKQNSFQEYDKKMANELKKCLNDNNIIVCIPQAFMSMKNFNHNAKKYWKFFIYSHGKKCDSIISKSKKYGNTNITRCYIDYKSKKECFNKFENIKRIWQNREIIIVEGEKSKLGVGNDLFNNAKSIKRILAPNTDAYYFKKEIIQEIKKQDKSKLILLSLGPTATILVSDLNKLGYQAIDIGHIDIEYEWFRMSAKKKSPIEGKFVNECSNVTSNKDINDKKYNNSIIVNIRKKICNDLVSVVIPTYNRSNNILERAINSAENQSYNNIEIIVVDDNANNIKEREKTKLILKKHPKVRLIENEKNLGGALSRNAGIIEAKGKYIAFLDDDDEFLTDKIEKQLFLIKKMQMKGRNVALVYCYKNGINQNGEILWNSSYVNFEGNCLFEHLCQCIDTTSTWLCLKETLEDVGLFEDVKAHQDNILLMKLLGKGYEIYRVPEILLNFYIHNGSGITNKNKKYIEYTKYLIDFKRKFYNKLNSKQIEEIEYNNDCMLFDLYRQNKLKKETKEILKKILKHKFRKHTLKIIYNYFL